MENTQQVLAITIMANYYHYYQYYYHYYHYYLGNPVSGCVLPAGWNDRHPCLLRAASRNPPHQKWHRGSGAFCFHLREKRGSAFQSQEAWGGEEDEFLLLCIVLISEHISPWVGEAAERGDAEHPGACSVVIRWLRPSSSSC